MLRLRIWERHDVCLCRIVKHCVFKFTLQMTCWCYSNCIRCIFRTMFLRVQFKYQCGFSIFIFNMLLHLLYLPYLLRVLLLRIKLHQTQVIEELYSNLHTLILIHSSWNHKTVGGICVCYCIWPDLKLHFITCATVHELFIHSVIVHEHITCVQVIAEWYSSI